MELTHISDLMERYLFNQFTNEFRVIDGQNQHPDGLDYFEWADRKYGQNAKKLIEEKFIGSAPEELQPIIKQMMKDGKRIEPCCVCRQWICSCNSHRS